MYCMHFKGWRMKYQALSRESNPSTLFVFFGMQCPLLLAVKKHVSATTTNVLETTVNRS